MLDTSQDYDQCAVELGVEPERCWQLLTPLTRYSNRGRAGFAIDNGAFSGFDASAFLKLLERETPNRDRCRFVVVPDVPMSARRTLEVFDGWRYKLQAWPKALACQNGQEDLPIPWDSIAAVFIAGDDRFKQSQSARQIVQAAKALGKWAHMGRVNTPSRVRLAIEWGVDSVDGTGLSRYSHMRKAVRDMGAAPELDLEDDI
jgi:hypothetical protein